MNKGRRNKLKKLQEQLEELMQDLGYIREEEEASRDNLPENLQGSTNYEKMEEAVSNLEDAVTALEDAVSSIEAAIEV